MDQDRRHISRGPSAATVARYSAALDLYKAGAMSMAEICRQTGVTREGFRAYIKRFHSDLLFARNGVEMPAPEAAMTKLRKSKGQTTAAHRKYRDAILACDSKEMIDLNIAQIAHKFHLDPSSLIKQLHRHYPEILERRDQERLRLGLADNRPRGASRRSLEQYAPAIGHLRETDSTLGHAADLYGLSYSGLREHLLFYNKELATARADRRAQAVGSDTPGKITGNGSIHAPSAGIAGKYREATELYRDSSLTQQQVCEATGVSVTGLRNHLRAWCRDLMAERHDVDANGSAKRYLRSTAAKYADAIAALRQGGKTTAAIAREHGVNPESFRAYLHEHHPELAASLGMERLDNGRTVRAASAAKYDDAIRQYMTSTETLKSIAERLGLKYNSLGGYIRRSRPDAIKAHNSLLAREAAG